MWLSPLLLPWRSIELFFDHSSLSSIAPKMSCLSLPHVFLLVCMYMNKRLSNILHSYHSVLCFRWVCFCVFVNSEARWIICRFEKYYKFQALNLNHTVPHQLYWEIKLLIMEIVGFLARFWIIKSISTRKNDSTDDLNCPFMVISRIYLFPLASE